MPEHFAYLPHSFPGRATPGAVLAVLGGFSDNPEPARVGRFLKAMDRALPRNRVVLH
jgi:hypothetical protein